MGLTFQPFRDWYAGQKDGSRPKRKTDMYTECNFSPSTVAKIFSDGFPVRSDVIETICRVYKLPIEQVIEFRRDGEE